MSGLFRREAVEARQHAMLGHPLLRPPVSLTVVCALAVALIGGVVALLAFGEYTRRVRVTGLTVPSAGLLKLVAPLPGTVTERHVEEGDRVAAGQVLFVLSAERMTDGGVHGAGAQTAILDQLDRRRLSLSQEVLRRRRLTDEQAAAIRLRLVNLQREAVQAAAELATHAAREASTAAQVDRYVGLEQQGFVSSSVVSARRDESLEQTARRQAAERALLAVQREIDAASAELRLLPVRAEQQQAEVLRELASLQQEIVGAESARRIAVVAPKDGIVTAIIGEVGQAVGTQPLATLLPADSPFEAHLFAPSRAVGFVEPGQTVRIRYAAYPFQKFGQYDGTVAQVSRTALGPAELPAQLGLPSEALYRIKVRLATPHVRAYGREQPLSAGMQLEADVMQDRRRLIEWVLEPLIALRRKA